MDTLAKQQPMSEAAWPQWELENSNTTHRHYLTEHTVTDRLHWPELRSPGAAELIFHLLASGEDSKADSRAREGHQQKDPGS